MAKSTKPQRPRRYGRRVAQGEVSVDPATKVKEAAPNFGRPFLPQILTFSGQQSTVSHTYRNPDEAIRHAVENARFMRNDCSIMECLEARQRAVALLNWHLEPEDKDDPQQKQLVADLTAILEEIERFTEYRRNLQEAIWYGRTAIANRWERRKVRGEERICIRKWQPVNGDKLAFRYDDGSGKYDPDQVGIRVGGNFSQTDKLAGDRIIEPTEFGMCYFLDPWERSSLTVHKHMIEDGEFEDPISAGRIHGVGIRHRIYWCWFQKQETMAHLMEIIERTGAGFTIYYYQYGNDESHDKMKEIAEKQTSTNVILMPRMAGDESMDAHGIERIEPSTAGIDALKSIIHEFFGHQIKRYILGQILSSESAATGLGSGVADLHQDTFAAIVQYDAVNLEETITREVLEPIIRYNFPWARDIRIKFKIDTKDNDAEKKLQAFKSAWDMGCKLKATDVMDVIGASMPDEDDEVLQNPSMQQQQRLWGQAHPGDMGPGGGVVGEDGQESPEGSIEDMFGPLAGELGGGEGGEPGPDGGGDQPPPGGPPGQGPQQYARQQVKSSPGQKPLFHDDTHRANAAAKWKEELHPRDQGGKFAEKGAGHKVTATEAPGGIRQKTAKSSPGQQLLGLAGDAADQIGQALPEGPEKPFELSAKPVRSKSLIPGMGNTQQKDLFAGRGDSPWQTSFFDDVDPASVRVADQKAHAELSPREAEVLAELHKTYKGLSGEELLDMARTISHKEAMTAAIDVPRDQALSVAQENRRRREESKRQNEAMVPALNENLEPPAGPPPVPSSTPVPEDDDPHLARAREVVAKIPKVSAKGLSVQLNGEVSEEHAQELLDKLRLGEATEQPAEKAPEKTRQEKDREFMRGVREEHRAIHGDREDHEDWEQSDEYQASHNALTNSSGQYRTLTKKAQEADEKWADANPESESFPPYTEAHRAADRMIIAHQKANGQEVPDGVERHVGKAANKPPETPAPAATPPSTPPEREIEAPTKFTNPTDEAVQAIAGMPHYSREESQAVARKIEEVASKHGMSGEELWRDVMGEPEGSSTYPLYDQTDDDERRATTAEHAEGRAAGKTRHENERWYGLPERSDNVFDDVLSLVKPMELDEGKHALAKQIIHKAADSAYGKDADKVKKNIDSTALMGNKKTGQFYDQPKLQERLDRHFGASAWRLADAYDHVRRESRTSPALQSAITQAHQALHEAGLADKPQILDYAKPSTIDSPAQGILYSARQGKAAALKRVQSLRERIKNEPMKGNIGGLRLEMIEARSRLSEYQMMEKNALEAIEKRANEQGLTTIKNREKK